MKKIIFLLLVITFNFTPSFALMPPEYLKESVQKSQIKTPAIVKKIKQIENKKGNRLIQVYFESMYQTPPYYFSGTCWTYKSRTPWDVPMTGPVFYYPRKNQKVFVTIAADGGSITSFVEMNEKFIENLKTYPERLKFGAFGAYFDKEEK